MKKLHNILFITAILLIISVFVHSALPHDHHYAADFHYKTNGQTQNSHIHCHTFNNALPSNTVISIDNQKQKENYRILFTESVFYNYVPIIKSFVLSLHSKTVLQTPVLKSIFARGSPLFG